jgi:hypothetical protein
MSDGVTMKNEQVFEVASLKSGSEKDGHSDTWINRARAEVGQSGSSQIASSAPYKPLSVEIDEFIKNDSSFFGLSRSDLAGIGGNAIATGDARKENLTRFLSKHFDDVASLSDDLPKTKLTTRDLRLYGAALKQRELSKTPVDFGQREFSALHHEHHIDPFPARLLGGGLGGVGAWKGMEAIAKTPGMTSLIGDLRARSPVGTTILLGATAITGVIASGRFGGEAADFVNRSLYSSSVRRHFCDEAAPAFARLMKDR